MQSRARLFQLLGRYGYLVGVLSAFLILLSSLGKDIVIENLRDAQKRVSAIANGKLDDQMDEIVRLLRNMEKDLFRFEQRDATKDMPKEAAGLIWSTERLSLIQAQKGDFSDLVARVNRLREKATGVPLSAEHEKQLADLSKSLNADANSLLELEQEYRRKLRDMLGTDQIPGTLPAVMSAPVQGLMGDYSNQAKEILDTYMTRTNEHLRLREEVYRSARDHEALLGRVATWSCILNLTIFVLGSMLGIYATYRAAKVQKP